MSAYIFVSGPLFSSGRITDNVRLAIEAGDRLMNLGFKPFIPHLSVYADTVKPRPEDDWVRLDLDWLLKCDAVLRLPGYSFHGDRETAFAKAMFIPVFYSIEELAEELG